MDLAKDLIEEISEKTGTKKEDIWNEILDYLR